MYRWIIKVCLGAAILAGMELGPPAGSFAASAESDVRLRSKRPIVKTENHQLAARRQLFGPQIRKRLVGVTVSYSRPLPARNGGTVKGALWSVLRPDGSFQYKCELYSPTGYAWILCPGIKVKIGGWVNGVWSIEGNLLCIKGSVSAYAKAVCYRLFDDDGRIFVEKASGERKSYLPGYVRTEPFTSLQCIGKLKAASC